MSQYGETNPHFWPRPRQQSVPQYIDPDNQAHHPDYVQPPHSRIRPRPRQDPFDQPSSAVPVPVPVPVHNNRTEDPTGMSMPLHPGYPGVSRIPSPSQPRDDYYEMPQPITVPPLPSSVRHKAPLPSEPWPKTRKNKPDDRYTQPYGIPPQISMQEPETVQPDDRFPLSSKPRPKTRKSKPNDHYSPRPYPVPLPSQDPENVHPDNQIRKPEATIIQPMPPSRRNRHDSGPQGHNLIQYPPPNKTRPLAWFIAVFCVILWLVIILGGLLVLIIYLVYRPRSPHFEISTATLNAALIDYGSHLNADVTLLANFTNLNTKMNVDFSYVILQLSYDKYHIATQYVEPFSAVKSETRLAHVEMVSSQVRLPITASQQLMKQIENNRVIFQVDGLFHARSHFGAFLKYSYWLYAHCTIVMTGPPSGVMTASKCRTKR